MRLLEGGAWAESAARWRLPSRASLSERLRGRGGEPGVRLALAGMPEQLMLEVRHVESRRRLRRQGAGEAAGRSRRDDGGRRVHARETDPPAGPDLHLRGRLLERRIGEHRRERPELARGRGAPRTPCEMTAQP